MPCPDGGKLVDPPNKWAHAELDDLEKVGREQQGSFEGNQWISGQYQAVEGEFGYLKYLLSVYGFMPTTG